MSPAPHHQPTTDDDHAMVAAWFAAAAGPIAGSLEEIYRDTAARIARHGPTCWSSGKCCRFREYGHLLYVTGVEAAYCVARAARPRGGQAEPPARTVSLVQIADAQNRGDCPFLDGTVCGVHQHRPLGCRIYFCEQSALPWQNDLSEEMLARIRGLHDAHGLAYRYGEWRAMLALITRHRP